MDDEVKILIDDYLRLLKTKDLSHMEICEIINVDSNKMKCILSTPAYSPYILEKMKEFHMTFVDVWNDVDKFILKGFDASDISIMLDIPVRQVMFRKRLLKNRY